MGTDILRDLYFKKTPYVDDRAPYPWQNAFRINNPRYTYIYNTYVNEMKDTTITNFRIIRFISLKYDICFDYVVIPNAPWEYLKNDVIKRLHEKNMTDVTDVKFTYEDDSMPVSEILKPYEIIPDAVFVHLSIIKRNGIWSF